MSLWAIGFGGMFGTVLALASLRQRIFANTAFVAITLLTIAAFYPLFTLYYIGSGHEGGLGNLMIHLLIFGLFGLMSAAGLIKLKTWSALNWLAVGILLHGVFDVLILAFAPHSQHGPSWWAEFCAAVDITLGLGLLSFRKRDLV